MWDFLSGTPQCHVSGPDILATMMNSFSSVDMNHPERRLYGALDIPMSKNGLALCGYQASPYDTGSKFLVAEKPWTTALTPSGAITHVHTDYYGRQQYVIHLFGSKLWLLWPPTEKNLGIYSRFHTQEVKENLTARCIDEMEGMQALYVTDEQSFVLKPNTLHACMCVATSAHAGTWFWNLDDHTDSFRMIEWGLMWLKSRRSTDAPISDYNGELETIGAEIFAWRCLLKNNPRLPDVDRIVAMLDSKYQEVRKLFKQGRKRKKPEDSQD